jgi:hypothetical protein
MYHFDYLKPVNIQKHMSDINLYNNLCQAISKMIANRNHDNYVQAIAGAKNYLGQFFVSNLDIISFDNRPNNGGSVVPDSLQNICTAISDITGYDHFSCLMGMLGATSIAMNGKYFVQADENWIEPVHNYILLLASSGGRKSAFIEQFRSPIDEALQSDQEKFDAEILNEIKLAVLKKSTLEGSLKEDIKKLKKECRLPSGKRNFNSLLQEIEALKNEYDPHINEQTAIARQKRPFLFVDQTTALGFMKLMKENGSLAVLDHDPYIIS